MCFSLSLSASSTYGRRSVGVRARHFLPEGKRERHITLSSFASDWEDVAEIYGGGRPVCVGLLCYDVLTPP